MINTAIYQSTQQLMFLMRYVADSQRQKTPKINGDFRGARLLWAMRDLNPRLLPCEDSALTS